MLPSLRARKRLGDAPAAGSNSCRPSRSTDGLPGCPATSKPAAASSASARVRRASARSAANRRLPGDAQAARRACRARRRPGRESRALARRTPAARGSHSGSSTNRCARSFRCAEQPVAVISTPSNGPTRALERLDGAPRPGLGVLAAAQVMHQRAAAARALQRHELDAAPRQHPRHRLVDLGRERGLHAARHQRDAPRIGQDRARRRRHGARGALARPCAPSRPAGPAATRASGANSRARNSPTRTSAGRVITVAISQRSSLSPSGRR